MERNRVPWCEKKAVPRWLFEEGNGDVRERRCAKCNKILAAYLVGEETS